MLGILEAVGSPGRNRSHRNHNPIRDILRKNGRMGIGRTAARKDFWFEEQRDSHLVLDIYTSQDVLGVLARRVMGDIA